MTRRFLFGLALSLVQLAACGQSDLFRLSPGEHLLDATWKDSVYRFPEFREGRVTFIKGHSRNYKLNYSLWSGEMEFINEYGDSLKLDNTPDLRLVNIGGRIFFHHFRAGYIEILVQLPVALGVKNIMNVGRKEVTGDNGYGQTSFVTSAVSSIYRNSIGVFSNADLIYEKTAIYFFIDKENALHVANKGTIMRLFPDHRDEIKAYVKANRINFRRKADMINLTSYVAQFY